MIKKFILRREYELEVRINIPTDKINNVEYYREIVSQQILNKSDKLDANKGVLGGIKIFTDDWDTIYED